MCIGGGFQKYFEVDTWLVLQNMQWNLRECCKHGRTLGHVVSIGDVGERCESILCLYIFIMYMN